MRQLQTPTYIALYLLLAGVYAFGLWVPLMNNDAAHHANIALHMFITGNYAFLIDSGMPYLDKPHFLFWISALSYHVFGVTTFAYKFPTLLFTVGGTWSTYKLGTLLYNKATGRLAAVIVASAFAYVLANNDVRMDAILTASIAFSTWQLVAFTKQKKILTLLLAALGLAVAFATKGWVGVVVPTVALFFYLAYKRQWQLILNPYWLLLIALFFLLISPVLYAYYLQFDMHPETMVRGRDHISGVKFILWDQNFERMAGENFGAKEKNDYFFFLHSLMWAFLPWSVLVLGAFYWHVRGFFRHYRPGSKREILTPAAILFFLLMFSFSKFKLPHYLNMLFPYFAIMLAGYLQANSDNQAYVKWFGRIQLFVMLVMGLVVGLITAWLFPLNNRWVALMVLLWFGMVIWLIRAQVHPYSRTVVTSVGLSATLYLLLNASFYPKLLKYQGASELAFSYGNKIDTANLRYLNEGFREFSFYFYLHTLPVATSLVELHERKEQGKSTWLLIDEMAMQQIKDGGFVIKEQYAHSNFHVTRLKPAFLNPASRQASLSMLFLIRL
ncbi:4-amino-4-deoxy-L-arabinose transferase [bacterium A37T11]|nr:4-amino-4-deoxy-L-arabinose transferase [bacterium A37T11]